MLSHPVLRPNIEFHPRLARSYTEFSLFSPGSTPDLTLFCRSKVNIMEESKLAAGTYVKMQARPLSWNFEAFS
jgi:hypothetical protein